MTADDLIRWCGLREAAIRWGHDELGRQVVEVSLPHAGAVPALLTVAANAEVDPGELLQAAVERWTTEIAAAERRAAITLV